MSLKFVLSPSLRIALLQGGRSSERAISLRSGRAVKKAFQQLGVKVQSVDPRKTGWKKLLENVDVVFIALHGGEGESGEIQAWLNQKKIPYVGSGVRGCQVSYDKVRTKKILLKEKIPTPSFKVLEPKNWCARIQQAEVRSWVVKPACEGSSFGVFFAEDLKKNSDKIRDAVKCYGKLVVEERIYGRELTVGVLDGRALPVIEVIPKRKFYDYKAKYTAGMTDYVFPKLSPALLRNLENLALRTHEALGLRDFSRIDFIVDSAGVAYVLEANSIPGLTQLSLLPKAAAKCGVPFPDLCSKMIEMALNRGRRKNGKKKKN